MTGQNWKSTQMENAMEQEHLEILKMVAAGQIGAEEAALLLEAVGSKEQEEEEALPSEAPVPGPHDRWANFWLYPLMGGGLVLILGAMVVALVFTADAAPGWLVCGWLPMALGALVILLAWWSRQARWLHLRISEQGGRRRGFSFPLPLGLAGWVLRIAQPFVPQLKETGVDDLIIALRDGATRDTPLFIDVQDGKDGERVELYIG
jgi:hypothetical protein